MLTSVWGAVGGGVCESPTMCGIAHEWYITLSVYLSVCVSIVSLQNSKLQEIHNAAM